MTQPERLFAVDAEGFLRASYPASVPAAGLAADLQKLGRGEAPVRRESVLHFPRRDDPARLGRPALDLARDLAAAST